VEHALPGDAVSRLLRRRGDGRGNGIAGVVPEGAGELMIVRAHERTFEPATAGGRLLLRPGEELTA
jgi:hypothetical protein